MSDTYDNHNIISEPNSKVDEKKTSSVYTPLKKGLDCALLVVKFGVRIIEVRMIEDALYCKY